MGKEEALSADDMSFVTASLTIAFLYPKGPTRLAHFGKQGEISTLGTCRNLLDVQSLITPMVVLCGAPQARRTLMSTGNVQVLKVDRPSTLRHPLVKRQRYLSNRLRILRAAFRSFRGHIRSQSPGDPLGRCLSQLEISQGLLTTLPEPSVISVYMKNLLVDYPWCDTVDLRFFLIGFGLGGQYSSGKQCDVETNRPKKVDVSA